LGLQQRALRELTEVVREIGEFRHGGGGARRDDDEAEVPQ
jgi:hypothetical protein